MDRSCCPTSFVGRTDELRDLTRRLAGVRLLTLAGAGGTGKTRLALELADLLADGFEHGAWLIELGQMRNDLGIDEAVFTALDLPLGSGPSPRQRLVEHLRSRATLLVVDNCEHVIDGAASLITDVLTDCPDVVVVATSREPLSVSGEHVVLLDSLPVETSANTAPSPAAALFVERARSEGVDVEAGRDAGVVEELCRHLDGIPLAIELAAGRARSVAGVKRRTLLGNHTAIVGRVIAGDAIADSET